MPINYNIEEDAFYKEGLKKGIKKGIQAKEAESQKKEEATIKSMIKDGVPFEKIASYLNVSVHSVDEIAEKSGK